MGAASSTNRRRSSTSNDYPATRNRISNHRGSGVITGSVSTASGSTNNVPQGRIVSSSTSSTTSAGANSSRPGAYSVSRLVFCDDFMCASICFALTRYKHALFLLI